MPLINIPDGYGWRAEERRDPPAFLPMRNPHESNQWGPTEHPGVQSFQMEQVRIRYAGGDIPPRFGMERDPRTGLFFYAVPRTFGVGAVLEWERERENARKRSTGKPISSQSGAGSWMGYVSTCRSSKSVTASCWSPQ